MTRRVLSVAVVAAVLAWGSAETSGQHTHGAGPPPAGVMDAAACAQAKLVVDGIVDSAMAKAEAARLSNSPAEMRAAMDALQRALTDIRTRLAPCAGKPAGAPASEPAHADAGRMEARPAAPRSSHARLR